MVIPGALEWHVKRSLSDWAAAFVLAAVPLAAAVWILWNLSQGEYPGRYGRVWLYDDMPFLVAVLARGAMVVLSLLLVALAWFLPRAFLRGGADS